MYNADLAMMDWRRRTSHLYSLVRSEANPADGHAVWRAVREEMFRSHPQSPLLPDDPLRTAGVPYWPYDPSVRFELDLIPSDEPQLVALPTSGAAPLPLRLLGIVRLPAPLEFELNVWRVQQYGGGLFVPLLDGTAGTSTFAGGRYLLDTVKGADLGGGTETITIDLNFAYHPPCHYNPAWTCALAPDGNVTDVPVRFGEMSADSAPS
jgi:uncharacterized protein